MMRRRALLAASMAAGGGGLQFPLVVKYGQQTKELFDALNNYILANGVEEGINGAMAVDLNIGEITVEMNGKSYAISRLWRWFAHYPELHFYSIRLQKDSLTWFDILVDTYQMTYFID